MPGTLTAPHLLDPQLEYVTAETFEAYHLAIARGFQEPPRPTTLEMDRRLFEYDRSFGFAVGERWVATYAAFSRELTVPGGATVPTAAVTVVTVHPPFRRRGLLTRMMRRQLEDCAERGEPLAALWASESLIYGRFGFGPAVDRAVLRGSTRRLQFLPGVVTSGSTDEVTREDYLSVAPGLHERMRQDHAGAMVRTVEQAWEFALLDEEFARDGASELRHVLHFDEAGEPDGFATYRFKESYEGSEPTSEVRVSEVWAEEPTAYAGLWRHLLDLDLARRFRARTTPLDERLRHMVTDARAVETEITDGLYLRVVEVAAALRARSYAAAVDLVLEVEDPLLPANTGRWRLVTDSSGSADVTRVDTAPDLSLGILELGTAYLGGVRLTELQRVGRVTEHTAGSVAAATTAFGWHRAPWATDFF